MTDFDPQDIARWTRGSWSRQPKDPINGFCFDARQLESGQCFVALSGGARDGHEFVQQAQQGGAVAAIVEDLQGIDLPQLQVDDSLRALGLIGAAIRSSFERPVVGITGSCGKTSTKEMLRILLGETQTHATAGNWNNRIGVPMTLFGLDSDSHQFAVIEAGINQPEEMCELGKMIHADLNVLTNIGPAHLELLGSLENIAAEKSLLAQYAVADSPIILPAGVLNYPAYADLADRVIALIDEGEEAPSASARQYVSYSIRGISETQQQLIVEGESYTISSPSRGIATNAALAITAAKHLGISEADIRERIEAWHPTGSRGRIETVGEQSFYIDCYNANPASMADALDAFVRSASQDVAHMFILGGMNELGDTAAKQHEAIGHSLKLRAQDRAIFVGPETFTQAYELGAIAGGADASQVQRVENIEILNSTVADFEGAIFLKGSRAYQLEKLLPPQLSNS